MGVHNSIQPVRWVLESLASDSSLTYHIEIPASIFLDHSLLTRRSVFGVSKPMLEDTTRVLGISPLPFLYVSYLNLNI